MACRASIEAYIQNFANFRKKRKMSSAKRTFRHCESETDGALFLFEKSVKKSLSLTKFFTAAIESNRHIWYH